MPKKIPRHSALDPQANAVQRLAAEAREQMEAAASGTTGAGKPGHAGKVGVDRSGRAKITLDVSKTTQQRLREAAAEHDCSIGDMAEAGLIAWLNWLEQSPEFSFNGLRQPARSLRVIWKLELPEDFFPF